MCWDVEAGNTRVEGVRKELSLSSGGLMRMRDWEFTTLGRNTAHTGMVEEEGMAGVLGGWGTL